MKRKLKALYFYSLKLHRHVWIPRTFIKHEDPDSLTISRWLAIEKGLL